MTIVYKVKGYNLTTSTLTTVLTIDASSRAIVKEITIANDITAKTTAVIAIDLSYGDCGKVVVFV